MAEDYRLGRFDSDLKDMKRRLDLYADRIREAEHANAENARANAENAVMLQNISEDVKGCVVDVGGLRRTLMTFTVTLSVSAIGSALIVVLGLR